jgi:hypothetical protein
VKRVLLASASALPLAATLGGCYWLASYADLTSGLAEAGTDADIQVSEDAGVAVEAGAAPADGSGASGSFCPTDAGSLSYCMDFDGIDAGGLGLGSYEANAAVVAGTFVSPPSSLSVNLYGTGSNGGYNVDFPFQPSTARLEFEIMTLSLDQWVTTLAISLYQSSTQTARTLNVVVSPQGEFQVQEYIQLGDGGVEQDGHQTPPLDGGVDAGAWHHVVLSMTVDDANQEYLDSLTVDGQALEDGQPLALPWAQGNASLAVGVTYGGGGGPQFYFDNVRVDFGL